MKILKLMMCLPMIPVCYLFILIYGAPKLTKGFIDHFLFKWVRWKRCLMATPIYIVVLIVAPFVGIGLMFFDSWKEGKWPWQVIFDGWNEEVK